MNQGERETIGYVVFVVILAVILGYLVFEVWAVRKEAWARTKAETEEAAWEQRLQTTVKLLEQEWGNRATVYRRGDRIAVIVTNPDRTWYVSEFQLYPNLETRTLHYGLLCPSGSTPIPLEQNSDIDRRTAR